MGLFVLLNSVEVEVPQAGSVPARQHPVADHRTSASEVMAPSPAWVPVVSVFSP